MWGNFNNKNVHNPPNDIEAWEINHGYPYPNKLEPSYYCTKENKLCVGEYSEHVKNVIIIKLLINLIEMIKKNYLEFQLLF